MTFFDAPFDIDVFTMGEQTPEAAFERLYEVHPDGENKGALSGRVYEHTLNVYCHRVRCKIGDIDDLEQEYLEQCHLHLKKNFTYFRRGNQYTIQPPRNASKGAPLQINVPQMRFLNWVAVKKIDRFILENIDDIVRSRSMQSKAKVSEKRNAKNNICDTENDDELAEMMGRMKIGAPTSNTPLPKLKTRPSPLPQPPLPQQTSKKLRRSERKCVVKKRIQAATTTSRKVDNTRKDLRVAKWHHPPPGKVSFEKRFGLY